MSPVITIPLEKNDEIAALVADMQPSDELYLCCTIKAKDAQSLVLRIKEVAEDKEDLPDKKDYDEDDEEEKDDDSMEEEDSNGSTPSETDEAIRLASPGGYMGP